ncbi:MAG: hypothetical protein ACYC7E_16615 [Armatimonadota bacterium]
MGTITVPANYYQQFDADYGLDVPAEGFNGWQQAEVELSLEHTAVVVMHAWDGGTREEYPGWYRVVEYLPRAMEICRTVFPPLLGAVRSAGLTVYHVVGGGNRYQQYPGYQRAVELAGPPPPRLPIVASDPTREALDAFRVEHAGNGTHNKADIERAFATLDFAPNAFPQGEEGIAENEHQLFALCKADGINHLIYAGFAINWCLLLSPGGMADMRKYNLLCSAFRQAVTAVENHQSARHELCKELGLWRVSKMFGFVFDVDSFIAALASTRTPGA